MKESLQRIFNTGWLNFRRNSYVSFATTGVMVLVLVLFSALLAINYLSLQVVVSLQEKVDITAYFKFEAGEEEIMRVKNDIQNMSLVREVEYISREQALDEFKNLHSGDVLIQESLTELGENPLQASLNIRAADPSQYAEIVTALEANKFRSLIDKINFYENEQVIDRVQSISGGLQSWGFTLTIALAVVAVLVTFNTIRLTIYNQKQEIEIMKLVGGSNWHIRAPYLVEGGLYGTFAALVTLVLFYPILYVVSPKLEVLIPNASLMGYFTSNSFLYIGMILGSGILLGVISSFIAIRRFLNI